VPSDEVTVIERSLTLTLTRVASMAATIRTIVLKGNDVIHEVTEGVIEQSSNEAIAYELDCSGYPSDPASVSSVTAYDITAPHSPTDVSATVLSGSASVSGAVITLKKLGALTVGKRYRVRTVYVGADGNTYEAFFDVECLL
jgi:hypothetical protein